MTKRLVLANMVWGELFLKFYFKRVKKIKKIKVLMLMSKVLGCCESSGHLHMLRRTQEDK
jgi:hypothetical protein